MELEAGGDPETVRRKFERDKDDLRELGLVIDTVESLDGEIGYQARRDRNRLPEIANQDRIRTRSISTPARSIPGCPARFVTL